MKNYIVNDYKNKFQIGFKEFVLGCDIGGTNTNIAVAGILKNKPYLLPIYFADVKG